MVRQEMRGVLEKGQAYPKGNARLKPMMVSAQTYIRNEVSKMTPNSGTETQSIIGVKQGDKRHRKIFVPPKAIYYGLGISHENLTVLEEIAVRKNLIRYQMTEDAESKTLKPILIESK